MENGKSFVILSVVSTVLSVIGTFIFFENNYYIGLGLTLIACVAAIVFSLLIKGRNPLRIICPIIAAVLIATVIICVFILKNTENTMYLYAGSKPSLIAEYESKKSNYGFLENRKRAEDIYQFVRVWKL